jgi:hypothetical protein
MRKLSDFIFLLSDFFLMLMCIFILYFYKYVYSHNYIAEYALQACMISTMFYVTTYFLAGKINATEIRKREKEIIKVVDSIGQPDG